MALLGRNKHAGAADPLAIDLDRPRITALEATEQPQQRGLAAAGRAKNRHQAAGRHRQIDATQYRGVAKRFTQAANFYISHVDPYDWKLPSTADLPNSDISSQVENSEIPTSMAAYGAAAAKAIAEVSTQTCVASVWVPMGDSNKVAVSSVTIVINTIEAAAPMPGPASGRITRHSVCHQRRPNERAVSSRRGSICTSVACTPTRASGRNRIEYVRTNSAALWYSGWIKRIEIEITARAITIPGTPCPGYAIRSSKVLIRPGKRANKKPRGNASKVVSSAPARPKPNEAQVVLINCSSENSAGVTAASLCCSSQ